MKLNIIIDDHSMDLEIGDDYLKASSDSFSNLDRSMDKGIQLGREWISQPNQEQRCQLAADKLLAAIDSNNEALALLSGGYIISQRPDTQGVKIDTNGEPNQSQFF